MNYRAEELAGLCAGRLTGHSLQTACRVAFDTRRLVNAAQTLFVAIRTERNDGHRYLSQALDAGVRLFLVSELPAEIPGDTAWICVDDTLRALQEIAAAHRKAFHIPVAGITGSNGKTIVKEWLYQLLSDDFRTLRSPGSFNSQIGVPLSVLALEKGDQLALFEAGISHKGEMQVLANIIKPNLGIFTHLGPAHQSGFSDLRAKLQEKFLLFEHCDVLVCGSDQPEVREAVSALRAKQPLLQVITWGSKDGAKFQLLSAESEGAFTRLKIKHRSSLLECRIPFADRASIENALSCLCVLYALERLDPEHLERFSRLQPVSMRLEALEGWNNCRVVNDSYSSDLDSFQVALQFLSQQSGNFGKTVVLSDLADTAGLNDEVYPRLAALLREHRVNRVLAVGAELKQMEAVFHGMDIRFFSDTDALLEALPGIPFQREAILLKGARRFRFERIARLLEKKSHSTRLEVDLGALRHNYHVYRKQAGSDCRLMAMVKAFAYGSGGQEVALLLQDQGADYFAVAYPDEGVELRQAGIHKPVMVLNTRAETLDQMAEYGLEPVVYSTELLEALGNHPAAFALPLHLEIDSGMHRLGFQETELTALLNALDKHPHLRIASIFSHLSASEAPEHDDFTRLQIDRFERISNRIHRQTGQEFIRHILNTAGIVRFPDARFDMVRLGIGLYGIDPSEHIQKQLKPVAAFRSVVSQVQQLEPGESVGYGRRAMSNEPRSIAVIAVGYADGLRRELGNGRWQIRIGRYLAPIVGSVCMDMCMADVTGMDVRAGDEVVIFGQDPGVQSMAAACHTIPYEILTAVSQRVKRVFIKE
jgi:alanine racemase